MGNYISFGSKATRDSLVASCAYPHSPDACASVIARAAALYFAKKSLRRIREAAALLQGCDVIDNYFHETRWFAWDYAGLEDDLRIIRATTTAQAQETPRVFPVVQVETLE